MTENNTQDLNSKIVFRAYIARRLLKMGNSVIDIKPDRNNAMRTLFVFENTDKFKKDFATVLNDIDDERMQNKNKDKKTEKE